MNKKESATDDEIGLTEDEIKEITGDDTGIFSLAEKKIQGGGANDENVSPADTIDTPNHPVSTDDYSDDIFEEIDFSDLDKKIDELNIDDEDDLDHSISNDTDIDGEIEQNFDKINKIPNRSVVKKEKKSSVIINKKSSTGRKNSVRKSITPKDATSGKSVQKSNARKSKPNKQNNRYTSEEASTQKVISGSPRDSLPWNNTVEIKNLFIQLDEMLSELPDEQVKKFVCSKEYDLYLSILKKLGI